MLEESLYDALSDVTQEILQDALGRDVGGLRGSKTHAIKELLRKNNCEVLSAKMLRQGLVYDDTMTDSCPCKLQSSRILKMQLHTDFNGKTWALTPETLA